MAEERPHVVVLAGPNGAGKSTAATLLLAGALGVQEFVNADVIAKGLSAFQPEQVALQAGRMMLDRLRQLAKQRVHFAFETTLASRSFAPWLSDLRRSGYDFNLVFLWLATEELAVARVRTRVQLGGHDVPEETIRRRYRAGLRNFFELYRPLADGWRFYDNSEPPGPQLLASGKGSTAEIIPIPTRWDQIVTGFANE
jgi:predicted ABC-type ATPase